MKKNRKMRMIWSTNAPFAHSGYSTEAKDLFDRFVADGWPVACSCFYGLEGGALNVGGVYCYPKIGQQYGTDALYYHQQDFNADIAFTFQDVWVMDEPLLNKLKNWIPYVPIDHDPVPSAVFQKIKNAYQIVTISKFGHQALENAGLKSKLISEATDINRFKPMDKKEMRKMFNIPEDIFLFGMVAANKDNPPRKSFQHCMDAFYRFQKNHPKSGIFFNTLLDQTGGFPIKPYADFLGIPEKIYFPPPYQHMFKSPHDVIAKLYNTFDCLLNPSSNEGFGLPIIEAQACGVPAIVNNFTSMPELVVPGKTGLICDHGFKRWTPLGSYVAEPDVNSLYDKMEEIYRMDREQMRKDSRQFIVDNYDIDKRVKEEWIPFFEELQESLKIK